MDLSAVQVLPRVVSSLGTHLTHVKLHLPRWRWYMVLEPMPMNLFKCDAYQRCTVGCGVGLSWTAHLHTM